MKIILPLALIAGLSLVTSCRSVIDVPDDAVRQELTVLYAGQAGSTDPQEITVSYTDIGRFHRVNDAEVRLTVDGVPVAVAPPPPNKEFEKGRYSFVYPLVEGQNVSVSVRRAGRHATASAVVLPAPEILDLELVNFERENSGSHFTNEFTRWKIRIKDKGGVQNYYRLHATEQAIWEDPDTGIEYRKQTQVYTVGLDGRDDFVLSGGKPQADRDDIIDMETIFGSYSYTNRYIVFSDELFDGKEVLLAPYSSRVPKGYGMYNPEGPSDRVEVEEGGVRRQLRYKHHECTIYLQAISRDMYRYLQTLGRALGTDEDNPFSVPVQMYTNIEGGVGIFGVNTEVSRQVYVKSE